MKLHRIAFIAVIGATCALALGGGVRKIDDTVVDGEVVAFDGASVTVERKLAGNPTTRESIAIEDIVQVRFGSGSMASTTQPTTQPAASQAAPSQPGEPPSRSAVAGLLRLVGLRTLDDSANSEDQTPEAAAAASRTTTRPTTSSSPTTLPTMWQLTLTNDDIVRGNLVGWTDDQRVTMQHQSSGQSLELPADRVAEIWHATPELERKARALKNDAKPGEDIAYVLKGDDVVPVSGIALGIDGESLSFRYDEQDRKINRSRLVGLTLSPKKDRAANADAVFHQVVRFSSGDLISGKWSALADGSIALATRWGQSIAVPSSAVVSIDCRNGRVVQLADLRPAKVEQTPFFDRIVPWRADVSESGGPLLLSDGQYVRGIAMHSRCVLEFPLGGTFERFKSRVGFEQPAGAIGRAAIAVLIDGKSVFENTDARGDQPPVDVDVDVAGGQTLTLVVDFGRDQDVGDRVIWANARLVRSNVGR